LEKIVAFDSFLMKEGNPQDFRIVVAMSGGVDSSVAACLMKEAGYDVVGVTLQLYDYGAVAQKKGACCAGQDIYDAAQVAQKIDIPHYVFNYEDRFREGVVNDFVDTYLKGATPVPCIRCNQTVKFRDLLSAAKDLNADALVTGHYVQWVQNQGISQLHRGADPKKDQSYFLFTTSQEQLDFLRFPLGHMSKDETRAIAKRFELKVSDKPDSMDICFVPDGNYAAIVSKLRPGALDKGNIVHLDGRVLGEHDGIIGFTVGQRKGIGIGGGDALYVVRLNADTKEVIVGPKEALAKKEILIHDINWLGEKVEKTPVMVKYRSYHEPLNATLEFGENSTGKVIFDEPQYGVSPGQACVFYDQMRLLGGGWISLENSNN
jgi:tRNA-specific 2-thiouridylase